MRDYLNIGSTPAEEPCLQVGHPLALQEVTIYKRQLQREVPEGTFTVKGFDHDFGRYYEVVAWFEEDYSDDGVHDPETQAAYAAESDASPSWDKEAKEELKELKKYM